MRPDFLSLSLVHSLTFVVPRSMFLSTRDPSVEFAADLNSRVTMVNFSVRPPSPSSLRLRHPLAERPPPLQITRASLQTQSLAQVLRVERPEVDRKRSDLLRLQGEFRARLHHLEKSLLTALNESQGNILDDDKCVPRPLSLFVDRD